MGKLIPSLEDDLKARKLREKEKEIKRKKAALKASGQEYYGDDDDLVDRPNPSDLEGVEDGDDGEDNTIPNPVAHQMFKKYMGYSKDSDMDHIPDSVVWRDWSIFLYMLGRGLLSDYKL
jgi:hypothetical protein